MLDFKYALITSPDGTRIAEVTYDHPENPLTPRVHAVKTYINDDGKFVIEFIPDEDIYSTRRKGTTWDQH